MHTILMENAKLDLRNIIKKVVTDRDEIIIASDDGAVVLLDEREWSQIQETLRLLTDKTSLAALLESHAIRDRGEKPIGITPEEAFRDV